MTDRTEAEFVGLLYDAALGRASWTNVVETLSKLLGGISASLFACDPNRGTSEMMGMHGISDRFITRYGAEFFKYDLWAMGAARKGVYNRAQRGSDVVEDAILSRSLFYNEFMRLESDAFHLAGAILTQEDGRALIVGCHRSRKLEPFSDSSMARLNRLLPHISRAAEVSQRLLMVNSSQSTLDHVSLGTIQLSLKRRILHSNFAAEIILRSADGLEMANGGIRAVNRKDDAELQRLIASAAETSQARTGRGTGGGFIRISRRSGKAPYSVLVSPLGLDRVSFNSSSPAALLLISDPAAEGIVRAEDLRELFAFSPAEARLVVGLVEGKSLRDIAAANGISFATVRTLLLRATAKTDTHSQQELLRLVLSAPSKKVEIRSL